MAWTKLMPRNAWLPAAVIGLVAAGLASMWWNTGYWSARRSQHEINAMGSCLAYAEAQRCYARREWDNDGKLAYARPFTLLRTTPDENGRPIEYIDAAFAQATSPKAPKHGYYYGDCKTIGGMPVDSRYEFALCSTPSIYDRTGWRTFLISTEGTLWAKDMGRSGLLDDFPSDPRKAGWYDAEREGPPGVASKWAPLLPAALAGLAVGGLAWLLIVLSTRKRAR